MVRAARHQGRGRGVITLPASLRHVLTDARIACAEVRHALVSSAEKLPMSARERPSILEKARGLAKVERAIGDVLKEKE